MTWLRAALAVLLLCLALPASLAHADALDDARAAGLVGERPDGYVDAVAPNPPANIQQLITEINAQRRQAADRPCGAAR